LGGIKVQYEIWVLGMAQQRDQLLLQEAKQFRERERARTPAEQELRERAFKPDWPPDSFRIGSIAAMRGVKDGASKGEAALFREGETEGDVRDEHDVTSKTKESTDDDGDAAPPLPNLPIAKRAKTMASLSGSSGSSALQAALQNHRPHRPIGPLQTVLQHQSNVVFGRVV